MTETAPPGVQGGDAVAEVAVPPDALSPQALDRLTERVYWLLVNDLLREQERRGAGLGRWR